MLKFTFFEQALDLREVRQELRALSLVDFATTVCVSCTPAMMTDGFADCLVSCVAAEAVAWGRCLLCIWQPQKIACLAEQRSLRPADSTESDWTDHLRLIFPTREEVAAKLQVAKGRRESGRAAAGSAMIGCASALAKLAQPLGAVHALSGICPHSSASDAPAGQSNVTHCRVWGCVSTGAAATLCQLLEELCQAAAASPPALAGTEGAEAESRSLCGTLRLAVELLLQVWCSESGAYKAGFGALKLSCGSEATRLIFGERVDEGRSLLMQ